MIVFDDVERISFWKTMDIFKVVVFWVVTSCGRIPRFWRTLLPPSLGVTTQRTVI
jgi:hypothetical protein